MTLLEDLKKSWLQEKLTALNALYRKFGRDGLKDQNLSDVSLLVSSKQMQLEAMGQGEGRMELELEIQDLRGYVKGQLASMERGERNFQPRGRGR